jgi:Flp pilus assembly protein TadD
MRIPYTRWFVLTLALAGCGDRGSPAQSELNAATRLQLGDVAVESGNDEAALSLYTAVANDRRATPEQSIVAAEGLLHYGKVAQAQAVLDARLKEAPDNVQLHHALLRLRVVTGEADAAVNEADLLLRHDPNDDTAVADKAVALDLLGRHAEAQSLYRRVLAASPGDDAVRTDLALSLVLTGDRAAARAELAEYATRTDAPQRARNMLALLYAADGNDAAARPLLNDGADSNEVAALAQEIRNRGSGAVH